VKLRIPPDYTFSPNWILTTEEIGRAMIHVAKLGAPQRILESSNIRECAKEEAANHG
jgi:hypothetical protein